MEIQTFNHDTPITVNSMDGTKLKIIENVKYLGLWMESTEKDCKVRKIWSSTFSKRIKNRLLVRKR